ncbi:MAG: aldo/keto reductase [Rhizobiaceae bacterium]
MQKITLGRTGLSASVAGLGCGGHSRLGQSYGHSEAQSVDLVKAAIDEGVNLIDTAAAYGTEEIVGKAVSGIRDQIIISTKQQVKYSAKSGKRGDLISAASFTELVEDNLKRLGTDYLDILHLHGVMSDQYDFCLEELVPALIRMQEQGKIRFIGITERFVSDPGHAMLQRALEDDCWDVVMTGFNIINPSARNTVFPILAEKEIGSLIMFAVRRALANPEALREIVAGLIVEGQIDGDIVDQEDPLGFIVASGTAESVIEAAYRFCRQEPGSHVVLTGTGSVEHLKQNLASIQTDPLSAEISRQLADLFGAVDTVTGN